MGFALFLFVLSLPASLRDVDSLTSHRVDSLRDVDFLTSSRLDSLTPCVTSSLPDVLASRLPDVLRDVLSP